MRKLTWIRTGIASVVLAGAGGGAFAVGCGGDDTNNAPKDSGVPDTSTLKDTGTTVDTGTDAGADVVVPPAAPHAKLILVNASPDIGPVRLCFGLGKAADGSDTQITPTVALPHDLQQSPTGAFLPPGIYPGTGGAMADLADLSTQAVTGFVIPASLIKNENADAAAEANCTALIGATGQGTDGGALTGGGNSLLPGQFTKLTTIPVGALAHGTTELVALVGCLAQGDAGNEDLTASPAKCGSDYTGVNNINAKVFTLDRAYPDGGTTMGVQVIDLASAWAGGLGLVGNGGDPTALATALVTAADAAVIAPINSLPITYPTQAPAASVQVNLPDPLSPLFAVQALCLEDGGCPGDDGGPTGSPLLFIPGASPFALPLALIGVLSNGTGQNAFDGGTYFGGGQNYAFILLGDPLYPEQLGLPDGAANPAYDGFGLHIIAFPTNPVLPKTLQ